MQTSSAKDAKYRFGRLIDLTRFEHLGWVSPPSCPWSATVENQRHLLDVEERIARMQIAAALRSTADEVTAADGR